MIQNKTLLFTNKLLKYKIENVNISNMREGTEIKILKMVANFYHDLFYKNESLFPHQYKQLATFHINRPEIKKFSLGFCPDKDDKRYSGKAFAEYYEQMWLKYPQLAKVCVSMGLLEVTREGYKDGLAGGFTFPYYDEGGNLFNMAVLYPEGRWELLYQKDTLATFGIKQAYYDIQDYKIAILLEDIYDFFAIYHLLSPTGIDPCLLCKKIGTDILEKLSQLGAEQVFAIGFKKFTNEKIDLIFVQKTGDALQILNEILCLMQNKRLKRLIEVGLELLEKKS